MTGSQFRAIRKRMGLGRAAFAWKIGSKGNYNTAQRMVTRTEGLRDKHVPPDVERRVVEMLEKEPKLCLK